MQLVKTMVSFVGPSRERVPPGVLRKTLRPGPRLHPPTSFASPGADETPSVKKGEEATVILTAMTYKQSPPGSRTPLYPGATGCSPCVPCTGVRCSLKDNVAPLGVRKRAPRR